MAACNFNQWAALGPSHIGKDSIAVYPTARCPRTLTKRKPALLHPARHQSITSVFTERIYYSVQFRETDRAETERQIKVVRRWTRLGLADSAKGHIGLHLISAPSLFSSASSADIKRRENGGTGNHWGEMLYFYLAAGLSNSRALKRSNSITANLLSRNSHRILRTYWYWSDLIVGKINGRFETPWIQTLESVWRDKVELGFRKVIQAVGNHHEDLRYPIIHR